MKYRDVVALRLAQCVMYRRMFNRSFDIAHIRALRLVQLELLELRRS
jgi:hypothetical protein